MKKIILSLFAVFLLLSACTTDGGSGSGNSNNGVVQPSTSDIEEEKGDSVVVNNGENGIKITNSKAVNNVKKIFDSYISLNKQFEIPFDVETEKNYEISVELKSDEGCYVALEAIDVDNANSGSRDYFRLSTTWKTCKIRTGVASYNWTNGCIWIVNGSAKTVYARNLTYTPIDSEGLECAYFSSLEEQIGKVSFSSSTKDSFKVAFEDDCWLEEDGVTLDAGVDVIFNEKLELDKFYKLTFNVCPDIDLNMGENPVNFWMWGKTLNYTFADSGISFYMEFPRGEKTPVTIYFPTHRDERKYRKCAIPYVCYLAKGKCEVTVSDIEIEETTIPAELAENEDLALSVAGLVYQDESQYGVWKEFDISKGIALSNGARFRGQVVLCEKENAWNSDKYSTTAFRKVSDSAAQKGLYWLDDDEGDGLRYVNKTGKPVCLKFLLSEDYQTLIETNDILADSYSFSGKVGDEIYLDVDNWDYCDYFKKTGNYKKGECYKTTITIDSLKIRDPEKDAYAQFSSDWLLSEDGSKWKGQDYIEFYVSDSDIEINQKTKYVIYSKLPCDFPFMGEWFKGFNAVAKISDVKFEKITETEYNSSIAENEQYSNWEYFSDVNFPAGCVLVGSMNDWEPSDGYELQAIGNGTFSVNFVATSSTEEEFVFCFSDWRSKVNANFIRSADDSDAQCFCVYSEYYEPQTRIEGLEVGEEYKMTITFSDDGYLIVGLKKVTG